MYYSDRERKARYAAVIMGVKDQLGHISNKGELFRHYVNTDGLCEAVAADIFPGELWIDARQTEDIAYGIRCLEISTGKRIDLRRQNPSRWMIETVA